MIDLRDGPPVAYNTTPPGPCLHGCLANTLFLRLALSLDGQVPLPYNHPAWDPCAPFAILLLYDTRPPILQRLSLSKAHTAVHTRASERRPLNSNPAVSHLTCIPKTL